MNAEPRDDVNRAIDDALASLAAAEPRRVSATSVREAMGKKRAKHLPVWLAVAAALILGLLINRREILPAQSPANVATTDRVDPAPAPRPSTSPAGERATRVEESQGQPGPKPRLVRAADSASESPRYEGLPQLIIAPIDAAPGPTTARLDTDAIEIASLDIAPLVVPSLSPEPENQQSQSKEIQP